MTRKSMQRFSDKVMRRNKVRIPKSGNRFSDQIMRKFKEA